MRKILLKRILQKISLSLLWTAAGTFVFRNDVVASAGINLTRNAFAISSASMQAALSGRVSDVSGKALTDVTVFIKGSAITTQTDADGKFTINAKPGDTLVFTLVGFERKEVVLTPKTQLAVTMAEEKEQISQYYNTPYSPKKKSSNTGAIAELRTDDLTKTNTSRINGTFAGRVAGVYATQQSGEPGADDFSVSMRGQTPLIILDGVPQTFSSINPEEIESITFMKDAVSTAMMGIRSSNGVINITTKRGKIGTQHITFKALSGIQQPLGLSKFLNAYDYARLYNEALSNDGKPAAYSATDLDAYRTGSDPIGHPDVDWQKQILKNSSPYTRYDFSVSGGGKTARYYANLDYLNQQGLIKTADFNVYNTGNNYKRYIFRSNVDVDLSKDVNVYLNLFTRVQNQDQPGTSVSSIFSNFRATPNNAYPVLNANGSLGGNRDYVNNIYGQTVYSGYRPVYFRDFRVDLGLKGKLDKITKGLYVNARASINAYLMETITRTKTFAVFQQTTNGSGVTSYQQFGNTGTISNSIAVNAQNTRFYTELSTGYDRKFGNHSVSAILLGSIDNVAENSQLPSNLQGISGKASYNYKEKYLVDVAFAYNGSLAYPKTHRYGFFPAVGLGWNLKQEDFLRNDADWISALKLRASYGKTGNNNAGYFEYNKYYVNGSGYNFGETVTGVGGVQEGDLNNPNITWEKATKFNIGVDFSLFKNVLAITADYFRDSYYDLLQPIGNNTQLLGIGYPRVNLGKQRYNGVEFQVAYSNHIGSFGYTVAPNISTVQSKVVFQDEVPRNYNWMQRTGQPVDQAFGYIADGLFQTNQQASTSAVPAGVIAQAGDIKYRDLNNDGVIDDNDRTAIGGTKPLLYYGLNLSANWKGFDISALFQGVGNRTVYLSGDSYWEFQNNGKGQAYVQQMDRWTPATAATATYPRLSTGSNINNQQVSSYWFRSANYVRLRSLELGYSLPVSLISKIRLSGARIFVNGYNLFTVTSLKGMDPEAYAGGYPVQRLISAGVNIKL